MPLLGEAQAAPSSPTNDPSDNSTNPTPFSRKQSQHSGIARTAIMNHHSPPSYASSDDGIPALEEIGSSKKFKDRPLPPKSSDGSSSLAPQSHRAGLGAALTDTPATTAPNSPKIPPGRRDSGSTTASRTRPTTLDIPGLTKSRVSPDGRISQRDVGSKLVIVMVGLPARGKSYITKKITRYLNWLQHDTRIFNVGERRREAATGATSRPSTAIPGGCFPSSAPKSTTPGAVLSQQDQLPPPALAAQILVNGQPEPSNSSTDVSPMRRLEKLRTDSQFMGPPESSVAATLDRNACSVTREVPSSEPQDQSAQFFDPENASASKLREELAMATLDELLDYILEKGGSVGIFDATNSTLERRRLIMERIRERAGPELGVLFLESLCIDENLLESNMRLKLSGPDYKDQDPVTALADFKHRVSLYEKKYVPLGEHEERNNMPYVQMIDVGRKVVSHQIRGFLSAQTVYYLLNFNLAARQIWITRHGESMDNVNGKIGGDSELSEVGVRYGKALTNFIKHEREAWEARQQFKAMSTHFPPRPGDTTPPNPEYTSAMTDHGPKNFCVWTSMLKRSIQTAQFFDEEDFDIKQMRMLDELNAGSMEGLTYEEIRTQHQAEYELRRQDKLHYRYPGAGGEGYLDIINRLRAVIVEVERMTDHVLLVGHRSIARVLLAYFKGLNRNDVADLDVPLGMLYMLEPKPYGVEFKAYRYNPDSEWFDLVPDYQLRRAPFQTSC